VHRHTLKEIEEGNFSWFPMVRHPAVPVDEVLSKQVCQQGLIGFATGNGNFEGVFNELLPHIKPTSLEDYLRECWELKGTKS